MEADSAARTARPNGRKAVTRQALVDAVQRCVATHGYSSVTVESIVAEANVSRATFYLHFSGKSELVRAIVEELRDKSRAVLPSADGVAMDHRELTAAVRAWISLYRSESSAFVLWHEAAANEAGIERPIDVHRSGIVHAVVGAGIGLSSPDGRARADIIAGMMFLGLERMCFASYLSGWQLDEELLVDEVVTSWEEYFIPRLQAL